MKIRLSIALCLLKSTLLFPQNPSVSSGEGLFRSDVYSGTPNVSFPIHTVVAKDITVPITLNYTGGNGIKVNEEASWVGLGWNLNTGAFIVQSVKGKNDFLKTYGYYEARSFTIPYFYESNGKTLPIHDNINRDCWNNMTQINNVDITQYDLEPDVFTLYMNGSKTNFYFDKDGYIHVDGDASLIISCRMLKTNDLLLTNSYGFTIQTKEGLIYTFDNGESITTDELDELQNKTIMSTYFLSSIYSNKSKETVTFNYDILEYLYGYMLWAQTYMWAYNKTIVNLNTSQSYAGGPEGKAYNCEMCTGLRKKDVYDLMPLYDAYICPNTECTSLIQSINSQSDVVKYLTVPKFLKSITTSSNTEKVYFNMSFRNDKARAYKLDDISVFRIDELNKETLLKKQKFTYSYFQSDDNLNPLSPVKTYHTYASEGDPLKKGLRLKLTQIQEFGSNSVDKKLPIGFEYYEDVKLPYKSTFDIDYWGYYNYDPSGIKPHNGALVSSNLASINRNPTPSVAHAGLIKRVVYSTNNFLEYQYEPAYAGVRLKNIKLYDGTYKTLKKYVYEENTAFRYVPSSYSNVVRYKKIDFQYNTSICWVTGATLRDSDSDSRYGYTCSFDVYTAASPYSFSNLSSINTSNYTKITEFEGDNGENGKTEYFFPAISYNYARFPFVPIKANPLEGKPTKVIKYFNKQNISNQIVHKKIEETDFVYNYANYPTCSQGLLYNTTYSSTYPLSVVLYDYANYTRPLKELTSTTKTYDSNDENKFVTSTTKQVYDPSTGSLTEVTVTQANGNTTTNKNTSQFYYRNNFPVYSSVKNYSKFDLIEELQIDQTINADNSITLNSQSSTLYQYDAVSNLTSKWESNSTSLSNSKLLSTSTSFIFDPSYRKILNITYNNTGGIIQTTESLKENKTNGYDASFRSQSTIYGYKNQYPVAIASNADVSQIAHNGFEEGSLTGAVGWNLASNTNSLVNRDTDSENVFSGRFALKLTKAAPGTTNYSSHIFIKPTAQNGKYKFSCWIKMNTGMTKDAFIEIKSTQTPVFGTATFPSIANAYKNKFANRSIIDWQYVEVMIDLDELKLSAPTTDLYLGVVVANMDETKDIYVDDMRLHPVDAQMDTFTYKPCIGKTSESGPDSKPSHYEYDVLGRMSYIKDFRKNIVTKNQYFTK